MPKLMKQKLIKSSSKKTGSKQPICAPLRKKNGKSYEYFLFYQLNSLDDEEGKDEG